MGAAPRKEAGADAGDPVPSLMAGRIGRLHQAVMNTIGHEMIAGRHPAEVSREVLALLDDMGELLGEKVVNYAAWTAE